MSKQDNKQTKKISKKDINILTNKLDIHLHTLLIKNANLCPTIPSTFRCIENSSAEFRKIVENNLSLEHEIKLIIGKTLVSHSENKNFMRPPYKEYFTDIIKILTS